MTTANPSKYCAKEYHGERPCIDPLTMAELRLRCASSKTRLDTPDLFQKIRELLHLLKTLVP
jgi:hypothetical protein